MKNKGNVLRVCCPPTPTFNRTGEEDRPFRADSLTRAVEFLGAGFFTILERKIIFWLWKG